MFHVDAGIEWLSINCIDSGTEVGACVMTGEATKKYPLKQDFRPATARKGRSQLA